MFNNYDGVQQGILILNAVQNNQCIKESLSSDLLLSNKNNAKTKTKGNNSKMNSTFGPWIIIPQNSLLSFDSSFDQISKNQAEKVLRKKPFTAEEDELLLKLVDSYGTNDWKIISAYMSRLNYNRNVRQCKDRYFHYLDPKIKQSNDWTIEEDNLLLKKVSELGNKWKSMEIYFRGRTEIALRNRHKLLLRKESKKERRKKKDIMSDEYSFLDKIDSNHFKTNHDNKPSDPEDAKIQEFINPSYFEQELLLNDDQESPIFIDDDCFSNEEFNGLF